MTSHTVLTDLYKKTTGNAPVQIVEMPSSGSNRRYFRLSGEPTLIGVVGTCYEENRAFLYMAEHFAKKGLPVPRIFAVADDGMAYLQEDLGDTLLFNAIEKGRKTTVFSDEEKLLLTKTIRLLPDIQFAGADGMDFSLCYPASEFNARSILWDLNYFKYCFLKATGLEFLEDKLEDDFQQLCDVLLRSSSATFMYRDFQSRNVMIKAQRTGLLRCRFIPLASESQSSRQLAPRIIERIHRRIAQIQAHRRKLFLSPIAPFRVVPHTASARGLRIPRLFREKTALHPKRPLRHCQPPATSCRTLSRISIPQQSAERIGRAQTIHRRFAKTHTDRARHELCI